MIETGDCNKQWWFYINNKKSTNPVTMLDVFNYCQKFDEKYSLMLTDLLVKGFAIKLHVGKVKIKPI